MNFVIYNDNKTKYKYEMIILNFIGIREEAFKIYDYYDYKSTNEIGNIYIISTSSINKALKIVTDIRKTGDWKSQIIVITDLKKTDSNILINNLLILDYIDINDNKTNKLKNDLYMAYKILNNHKSLNFYINSEIYKIPYDDILYIEKINNQNYSTIITISGKYKLKETITNLEQVLDSAIFMKTHRSCIVNLNNIESYHCSQNIINFYNGIKIDLIARDKRKILKTRLVEEKIKII